MRPRWVLLVALRDRALVTWGRDNRPIGAERDAMGREGIATEQSSERGMSERPVVGEGMGGGWAVSVAVTQQDGLSGPVSC